MRALLTSLMGLGTVRMDGTENVKCSTYLVLDTVLQYVIHADAVHKCV